MERSTSKAKVTILLAVILAASVNACYIINDQTLTGQTNTTQSPSTDMAAMMSTTVMISNTSNWAGYTVVTDTQNPQPDATVVSASWTVPSVAISKQDTYTTMWIGIGGYFDNALIQTGTAQSSVNGQTYYNAWYEQLPADSHVIRRINVSPGDQMNASIQLVDSNTNIWSIYIEDLTTGQSFQNDFIYEASRLSAEWIVERPLLNNQLTTLGDIGNVSFTNCQATIGTQSGNISSFPAIQSVMYDNQTIPDLIQLTAVSDLTENGSSFSVETSPSKIPETYTWTIHTLIMTTTLSAVALHKIYNTRKKHTETEQQRQFLNTKQQTQQ